MAPARALHCPHFGAPVRVSAGEQPASVCLVRRGHDVGRPLQISMVESVVLMSH